MEDEKLIECVRKYEFLYNLQHPKHMDTIKKEIAWKDISDKIKQPAATCKHRWQRLRDAYRRAINKKKGKSGQAAKKIKKWKYEDEMSFVAPFFLERKTIDSVELTSDDNEDPDNDNETSDIDPNTSENLNSDIAINDTAAADVDANNTGTEIQKRVESAVQNNNPKKAKVVKKAKIRTVQSASAVLMAQLLDGQNKLEPHRKHDELDRFKKYISDTVKKCSPYVQAMAKNKIFSIVSEKELQHLAPPTLRSLSSYEFSNSYTLSPNRHRVFPKCYIYTDVSRQLE